MLKIFNENCSSKMLFENAAGRMMLGNLLLAGCCVFYLLWWILAFKPEGAVKGFRSGWLLIPAFILGIAAVVLTVRGALSAGAVNGAGLIIPVRTILIAGAAVYAALFLITGVILKRPVTTELFLIVGWTVMTFMEVNALAADGIMGNTGAVTYFTAASIAAAEGIVCYVIYYRLGACAGYADGMIPLILVLVFSLLLAAVIFHSVISGRQMSS